VGAERGQGHGEEERTLDGFRLFLGGLLLDPTARARHGLGPQRKMPLRCSAMALRDQRHPLGTGAKDVELLEGDADDLETTVLAALTDEVSVIRVPGRQSASGSPR
jgi:hypothetical protein